MATSRGFRSGTFLSGAPHLVGSGAALVGLAAGWFVDGSFLVSAGLGAIAYGAGFLLAPRRHPRSTARFELAAVRRGVDDLEEFLERNSETLDPELLAQAGATVSVLRDVLGAWAELETSALDRHSVESVVTDHLPTVLRNHLDLPPALRTGAAIEQLDVLRGELLRIRDLAYAGAVRRVEVQGLFLRDRFAPDDPFTPPDR